MGIELGCVLDSLPHLVWTVATNGKIEYANRVWKEYTGLDPTTSTDLRWECLLDEADLSSAVERFRTIRDSSEPGNMDVSFRRFDGERRRFLVHWTPLAGRDDRELRWCGTATDIDDFRVAVDDQHPELDFQLVVDSIPVQVAVTSPSGEVEGLNQPTLSYFGMSLADLKQWKASDVVHPDDLDRTIEAQLAAHANGNLYNVESRHRRFDGAYRWHNVLGLPLRNKSGEIQRWLHLIIDVEERKRAEEKLSSRQSDLLNIINALPTTAWSTRPDGYCDFLSDRWLDYAGLTFEEAEGWGWAKIIHPSDIEPLTQVWSTCLATGNPVDVEARMRDRDGNYRWFLFRANPLRDENGAIVKWYGTNIDIDDRRRAEEELINREREARSILNRIPALVATLDANGENSGLNEQFLEYFGLSEAEAKNWRKNGLVHPDDLSNVMSIVEQSGATGQPSMFECRLRGADGTYRWFQRKSLPYRDDSGQIVKWYSVSTDIHERRMAEERLRESERQLRLVVNTIPGLIVTFGPDGATESANEQTLKYVGQNFDEFRNWATNGIVHPDDLTAALVCFERSLASGEPYDFETRLRGHDGVYRWFQIRGYPARDVGSNIVRWYGLMIDINDRKRAEDSLARNERELSLIVHNMAGMIAIFKSDAQLDGCNQQLLDYFQMPLEEIANWATNGITHPDDLQFCIDSFMGSIASGEPYDFETRFRRFDGVYRWFQIRGHPVRDESGRIFRWYGLLTDIDDRKHAEDELRRSQTFLATGQRISQTGIFSWLVDTDELHFSDELNRIFEFEEGCVVTFEKILDRVHQDDLPMLAEKMALVREGFDNPEYEIRLKTQDGRIKYVRVIGQVMKHADGRKECLGAIQEVTDMRLAEEARDKLRSELARLTGILGLGQMAASIAHEVNQPLAGIITNASTCLRMLAADPPNIEVALETARRTIRDGNRAADVITRLRALFSKRSVTFEAIDLSAAVREVIALSASELQRNGVFLRTDLARNLPPVAGDRVQLQQVILNLIRNAADAMSGIVITSRRLVITTSLDEDNLVRLSVQDTGIGFHPNEADRIFEPFYTTKNDGMGMGLSVSRSIIESHNGRLWGKPNEGPGVTVSFTLPKYLEEENFEVINHDSDRSNADLAARI
jgi:PAS domain S-box-containing protein